MSQNDFEELKAKLEKLKEGQQELIRIIVEKIYEALKEKKVMAFAYTPDCLTIGEEILRAAYHISNLTLKHEK